MDILLIVACLYMAYSNIQSLAAMPFAEWGVIQYSMVVLTVLLLAAAGLKGWQFYKKKQEKKEAPGEAGTEDKTAQESQTKAVAKKEPVYVAAEDDSKGPEEEDWEASVADFNYTLVDENPSED